MMKFCHANSSHEMYYASVIGSFKRQLFYRSTCPLLSTNTAEQAIHVQLTLLRNYCMLCMDNFLKQYKHIYPRLQILRKRNFNRILQEVHAGTLSFQEVETAQLFVYNFN